MNASYSHNPKTADKWVRDSEPRVGGYELITLLCATGSMRLFGEGAFRVEHRIRIPIRNGGKADLVVVVEPWASEICLASGEDCEVVLVGNTGLPNHSIELCSYGLIICAEDGMDGHELWLRGERVVW